MSGKREESLAEASETLRMEQRNLNSCSLEYVKYFYKEGKITATLQFFLLTEVIQTHTQTLYIDTFSISDMFT